MTTKTIDFSTNEVLNILDNLLENHEFIPDDSDEVEMAPISTPIDTNNSESSSLPNFLLEELSSLDRKYKQNDAFIIASKIYTNVVRQNSPEPLIYFMEQVDVLRSKFKQLWEKTCISHEENGQSIFDDPIVEYIHLTDTSNLAISYAIDFLTIRKALNHSEFISSEDKELLTAVANTHTKMKQKENAHGR